MTTYKTAQVAQMIGIHPNTVRLYEEVKLIPKPERRANGYRVFTDKRKNNGYRVYTDEDIRRLKIIRSLRCANYSLEAILRLLRQLSQNPDTDVRATLNTPKQSADIISVCDRLIISLSEAWKNACKVLDMLQDMKIRFS